MFHPESTDTDRFEEVILLSLRHILAGSSAEDYLAWAREHLPVLLGLDDAGLADADARRLANLLATAIWNATPHPAHGYQPQPLTTPAPNAPCICGSGRRYADCCGDLDGMPELSTELIWEFLLDELSEKELRDALALDAVPTALYARIADRWLDAGRPGRAVQLLEPLFASPLDTHVADLDQALDVLCDAYDRLGHWRKKHSLLERLCAEGTSVLQGAAWRRRSTICLDEGDFEGAEEAFAAALRCNPDDPSTAMLEITLLVARHHDTLARARARFWLQRFRRLGIDDEAVLYFFERSCDNPREALLDSHADMLDPALVDLRDWVSVVTTRALPNYGLSPLNDPNGAPEAHPPLFEVTPVPGPALKNPEPGMLPTGAVRLVAPQALRQLEAVWRALYPGDKPLSIHLSGNPGEEVWNESAWIDYLLGHPEMADSLEVLDDLATALYDHPESNLPWIDRSLLRPLLDRAAAILAEALPESQPWSIPWSDDANRPALRLLYRRYLCLNDEGALDEAKRMLETLLRLNPQDNHGVRAELMNLYLREGEDEQALALAQRFPNDILADLAYGEVLALYRLGRQERARLALGSAMRRMPRIPYYLTRKRIKRPRLDPHGITFGGDDQAWLYREAMRDVWAAEPGILAWLKRLTA